MQRILAGQVGPVVKAGLPGSPWACIKLNGFVFNNGRSSLSERNRCLKQPFDWLIDWSIALAARCYMQMRERTHLRSMRRLTRLTHKLQYFAFL